MTFDPGDAFVYMKVGIHAQESLEDIIERKKREIDQVGFSMWGYGGNTCHPATMVQPFAKEHAAGGSPIFLVMEPMTSNHFAEPLRADLYSEDGISWRSVPPDINVLGSRFAMCLKSINAVESEIDLAETAVGIGNSKGRSGAKYVRGRVDKACLEIGVGSDNTGSAIKKIGFAAELMDPYAVFLKNSR